MQEAEVAAGNDCDREADVEPSLKKSLFLFVVNRVEWLGSRILESPSLGLGHGQETVSCEPASGSLLEGWGCRRRLSWDLWAEIWGSGERMVSVLSVSRPLPGYPGGGRQGSGKNMARRWAAPLEGLTGSLHSPVAMVCSVMELEWKPLSQS